MVVLGDSNVRVGNEVVEGIVGQHGVPIRNKRVNDYWRYVQSRSWWWEQVCSKKRMCLNTPA